MRQSRNNQITADSLVEFKHRRELFVGGSVYEQMDTIWATLAGMEVLLIGDSLANVKLGYAKTADVSMPEMLTFTRACLRAAAFVRRARPDARLPLFVFDIPFCRMRCPAQVLKACREALDGTADLDVPIGAVKIEVHQHDPTWREKLAALRDAGIPFMVHIGYTPQSDHQVDEKIVQGKTSEGALYLAKLTAELQSSGAFALFMESVPWQLVRVLTAHSVLPIIGLGAGPYADGTWLMVSDVLGITESFFALQGRTTPVFSPITRNGSGLAETLASLVQMTREGRYPIIGRHTYALPAAREAEILGAVARFLAGAGA